MRKFIGKTKKDVIAIMSNQCLEESNEKYLVYSVKMFFFTTRKIYIEFNENRVADTVYTR